MERLDYRGISAEGFGILGTLSKYVHDCGLEESLQSIRFLSRNYDRGGLMTEQPAQKRLAAALSTGRVG